MTACMPLHRAVPYCYWKDSLNSTQVDQYSCLVQTKQLALKPLSGQRVNFETTTSIRELQEIIYLLIYQQ